MIEICNISKSFASGKRALDSIQLRLERGLTHVLIGPSGGGKSTLLQIIMGLIEPDSGTVVIDEVQVCPENQHEITQKIGYVIQEGGLFSHLTNRQNVLLPARAIGRNSLEKRVQELLSLVELEKSTLDRFPHELSGGQRQRVSLMRALVLDPKVLLLDEPLGALDPMVRSSLQNEMKRIFNTVQKTVVMVTHDLAEAAFFGHTITLLNEGRIIQSGSFEDLLEHPKSPFVSHFISSQKPPPEMRKML